MSCGTSVGFSAVILLRFVRRLARRWRRVIRAHAACGEQVSAGDDNSCMRSRQQSSNDHEAPLPPAPVTCAFGERDFFGGWGIRSLSQREIT